ncbi:Mucin-associated surface protein (MASP) [Trypanosoma cruzi]|uniref:Mucin-associated surface protein (MASP), putative n=2 Tax=Trypanosoma cruzi TaxID=5693 RepID=Q4D8A3_TRYCC|nr:mucin-associated surface protein (MASP), putative [Trypanosoma cruzi]XP_813879.1 mucin-associated surface protein (MASP), putative [Trypanosoma cruzi]EAN88755.1 mucin-associated surface protein (MASP), putative [Trypanosoma cruzi]EAN92028.1 mucin-associated surface protein (MASP), putative [Trypanosoma cruzi]KAF8284687.1 Mucin-associated surface protein (MASP), subgroup S007 [Trypanosoma cruzi]KAF8303873.1 Mucin-associated surface protein (MASP), subgroup S007 [Trypanosoma cruzi]PWV13023.1|eukprot:XP_810606.1 mucin-associated surface protein (MASP) [Trypanosoma cruzi strain CL Brener]
MAMMMTGRVLLVCALCVLWCGAAVVVSSEPDVDGTSGDSASRGGISLESPPTVLSPLPPVKSDFAEDEGEGVSGKEEMERSSEEEGSAPVLDTKKSTPIKPQQEATHTLAGKTSEGMDGVAGVEGGGKEKKAEEKKDDKSKEKPGSTLLTVSGSNLTGEQNPRVHPPGGTQESEVVNPLTDSSPGIGVQQQVSLGLLEGAPAKSTTDANPSSLSTGGRGFDNGEGREDGSGITELPAAREGQIEMEDGGRKVKSTTGVEKELQSPVNKAANTSETVINGYRKSRPTAATALQSDDGSESNPATNGLNHSSSEGIAHLSTTPDPEDASEGTENATSQSAEIPTAPINTVKTNDTAIPGDSDGSTAIPHTTSHLLILLPVVACAAAAAVVAA